MMVEKRALLEKVRFANIAKLAGQRQGHDWYEWVVYVAEGSRVLGLIEAVEYLLHRTFVDPLRRSTDRDSKFSIRSSGWGEFDLLITVFFTDGSRLETSHSLDLAKSWDPSLPAIAS